MDPMSATVAAVVVTYVVPWIKERAAALSGAAGKAVDQVLEDKIAALVQGLRKRMGQDDRPLQMVSDHPDDALSQRYLAGRVRELIDGDPDFRSFVDEQLQQIRAAGGEQYILDRSLKVYPNVINSPGSQVSGSGLNLIVGDRAAVEITNLMSPAGRDMSTFRPRYKKVMRAGVATVIAGLVFYIYSILLLTVVFSHTSDPPWYGTIGLPIGAGGFVLGLALVVGGWLLGKLDGGTLSSSRRM